MKGSVLRGIDILILAWRRLLPEPRSLWHDVVCLGRYLNSKSLIALTHIIIHESMQKAIDNSRVIERKQTTERALSYILLNGSRE